MNLIISAGKDQDGKDVQLDLSTHHFVLLTGSTGTGKSIFHNSIYKQLVEQNTSNEIGLIFLDMTRVDFHRWQSPYILSNETSMEVGIEKLELLGSGKPDPSRHTFVHIEECNMFANYSDKAENAVREILANRNDVTIIYSTSRPGGNALPPSLLALIDTKIVFELSTQKDLDYVLGSENNVLPEGWGKILWDKGQTTHLQPFSQDDVEVLNNFSLNNSQVRTR